MAEGSEAGLGPVPHLRPIPKRRDTEAIWSYYQSDLADGSHVPDTTSGQDPPRTRLQRTFSDASSASLYSSSSSEGQQAAQEQEAVLQGDAQHTRRSGTNAEAADNRHAAVVQVDTPPLSSFHLNQAAGLPVPTPTSSDTLLARRGLESRLRGLAVVANLDTESVRADPESPMSAPMVEGMVSVDMMHGGSARSHQRSMTGAVHSAGSSGHHKTSSRDVGIVGTRHAEAVTTSSRQPASAPALSPHIFQTPQTRSPSSHVSQPTVSEGFTTPRPGQDFQSNARVPTTDMSSPGGPTPTVDRCTTSPISVAHDTSTPAERLPRISVNPGSPPPNPSPYLYYQPGIHSTAGPLPPPPRAMFQIDFKTPPPPRPPRLRSPSPVTPRRVHLDISTPTVSLVPRAPSAKSSLRSLSSPESIVHEREPSSGGCSREIPTTEPALIDSTSHVREGAFPPSTIRLSTVPTPSPPSIKETTGEEDIMPSARSSSIMETVAVEHSPFPSQDPEPEPTAEPRYGAELRRAGSWGGLISEAPRISLDDSDRPSSDLDSISSMQGNGPTTSPKELTEGSPKLKGALTSLKRFSSLPRTPSIVSGTFSNSSHSSSSSPAVRPTPRPRIRASHPEAMRFQDVLARKTALDRAIGYAQKINELAMYDCGLGDWMLEIKQKSNPRSSQPRLSATGQVTAPMRPISFQPRHASNGSISSQATFPRRPDAYVATDLSPRPIDTLPSPHVPPPALPYPTLAQSPPTLPTHRMSTIATPTSAVRNMSFAAGKTGGFFSSIGRNYSLTKGKERNSTLPPKNLTKTPPSIAPHPRPVQIVNAPTVPGGPRAPGRMQRSQTLILAPQPQEPPSSMHLAHRRSHTLKRPSLFGRPGTISLERAVPDDGDFSRQVDRLSDLLPHADKNVLAGYLRRAGQDILAIGQYLDDEKNGTIRRDRG